MKFNLSHLPNSMVESLRNFLGDEPPNHITNIRYEKFDEDHTSVSLETQDVALLFILAFQCGKVQQQLDDIYKARQKGIDDIFSKHKN